MALSYYITRDDLRIAPYLPVFLLVSWTLPERFWPSAARFFGNLPKPIAPFSKVVKSPRIPGQPPPGERGVRKVEHYFQVFRELRPDGWQIKVNHVGFDCIEHAHARGQGVVLWVATTRSSSLVAKKAFAAAGLKVHQLSRPEHGGGFSSFGRIVLHRIHCLAEDRSLAGRVMVTGGTERRATRALHEVLSKGGVIAIAASPRGAKVHNVSLSVAQLPLATGAPALAHATSSALIPVFCVRTNTEKRSPSYFQVTAGPPIQIDPSKIRKAAIALATQEFGLRHEVFLSKHADQWTSYGHLLQSSE